MTILPLNFSIIFMPLSLVSNYKLYVRHFLKKAENVLRECNTIALTWASMSSTVNISSEKMHAQVSDFPWLPTKCKSFIPMEHAEKSRYV